MPSEYEINELAKEESWRMFRIMGELVEGFDTLTGIEPAITIYGSSRLPVDDNTYAQTEEIATEALSRIKAVYETTSPQMDDSDPTKVKGERGSGLRATRSRRFVTLTWLSRVTTRRRSSRTAATRPTARYPSSVTASCLCGHPRKLSRAW